MVIVGSGSMDQNFFPKINSTGQQPHGHITVVLKNNKTIKSLLIEALDNREINTITVFNSHIYCKVEKNNLCYNNIFKIGSKTTIDIN